MAQSGSWCRVDSCGVHQNIKDISPNAKFCHSTETEEPWRALEHLRTLCRISSSQRVHTLIYEASQILLKDPSHDIPAEVYFSRTPTETCGTSSSEAKIETIPVVVPPFVSSDTKLEEKMPATSDTP